LESNTLAKDLLKGTEIEVKITVNGREVKGRIASVTNILELSIESFKVTKNEIRIVNPNPEVPVSILSITIATLQAPKDEGGKRTIEGAKSESFVNCPYEGDVVNCV